jgi:hypothetical protein
MKFSFKKILTVAATAVMLGGTVAAAAYPMPFVTDGSATGAVVVGANAATQDWAAAVDLQQNLNSQVTSSAGSTSVTGGDNVQLQRSTDKFNLMNNMSTFYSKIDESELGTVLAKGVYTNDAHDDFDYTQEIILGADLQLSHFLNSDFNDDKPIIGFDLNSDDLILNYTLKFTPDDAQGTDATWTGITGSYLPILGKQYFVLTMTNTTTTNHKITLLDSAISGSLGEEESISLDVDGTPYDVSVDYIDSDSVMLNINGEITDALTAAQTQKLGDGSYVGVKEVSSQGYAGGVSNVKFSIGSGKLVLENTKEVEINNEKLSATKYAVENSDETLEHEITSFISAAVSTDLDSIVLQWKIKDDTWIAPGTDLSMPGFESIKLSMGGFNTDKAEVTNLKGDSNTFSIKTQVTDGELDLDLFYLNSSSTGIAGLGKDATHKLVTSDVTGTTSTPVIINLDESLNNYFVVTWISGDDSETYAYKLGEVDEDNNNATVLTSITGGSDITIDQEGQYETEGNVKFMLDFAEEEFPSGSKANVTLNLTAASSGNVYSNRIVTAEGLEMSLPTLQNTTATGNYNISINATNEPTSWTQMFDEENKDETISGGPQFNATYAFSGTDGLEISALVGVTVRETESNSDLWEGYVSSGTSDLATMVLHDKPTSGLNELDITYHGTEAYADVFITESSAVVSAGNGDGESVIVVKDNEVSSVADKNLVVIGGSCINTVAAKILGSDSPVCGEDFSALTNVGANQFLIKVVTSPYNADNIAMLVAGYEAADTTNAVAKVKEGVTSDLGSEGVYPQASA